MLGRHYEKVRLKVLASEGIQTHAHFDARKNPLPKKLKAFADAYLEIGLVAEAARQAGYSRKSAPRTGRKLMNNPLVQTYIANMQKLAREECKLTIEEIIEKLRLAYDGATADGKWDAAIRAAELLGKHQGMFEDKSSGNTLNLNLVSGEIDTDLSKILSILAPKPKEIIDAEYTTLPQGGPDLVPESTQDTTKMDPDRTLGTAPNEHRGTESGIFVTADIRGTPETERKSLNPHYTT